MSNISYNPAYNAHQIQRNKLNFGSKNIDSDQNKSNQNTSGTKTGKILGGIAAYSLLSHPAQKTVITQGLPRISNVFKPLAEAMKQIPLNFSKLKHLDPDKLTKVGMEAMKLSTKARVGLIAASVATIIAVVTAGSKLGSFIQKQFQK